MRLRRQRRRAERLAAELVAVWVEARARQAEASPTWRAASASSASQ